jgi:hypothetical protein
MKIKNLPLIIGIALPVVFILIISVVIFTPSFFIKPSHNFLYTVSDNYYGYDQAYRNTYNVEQNRIVLEAVPAKENWTYKGDVPTLYLYEVRTNASHQITLDEAKGYVLDPGPSSPDGYTVAYQYSHNGVFELFGSNNDNSGYFISKGSGKKRLNGLTGDRYWNQGNFRLIGWIK